MATNENIVKSGNILSRKGANDLHRQSIEQVLTPMQVSPIAPLESRIEATKAKVAELDRQEALRAQRAAFAANPVKTLQQALIDRGAVLRGKNNGVDGIFGNSTYLALGEALKDKEWAAAHPEFANMYAQHSSKKESTNTNGTKEGAKESAQKESTDTSNNIIGPMPLASAGNNGVLAPAVITAEKPSKTEAPAQDTASNGGFLSELAGAYGRTVMAGVSPVMTPAAKAAAAAGKALYDNRSAIGNFVKTEAPRALGSTIAQTALGPMSAPVSKIVKPVYDNRKAIGKAVVKGATAAAPYVGKTYESVFGQFIPKFLRRTEVNK